jgi:hypothetical protein
MTLEPIAASTTLVNLRCRYAMILRNLEDSDIEVTSAAGAVFTGTGAQEAVLRQWLEGAALNPKTGLIVPAKGELRIEDEAVVRLGEVNAMQVQGRVVILPVIAVAATYRHATGVGKLGRAFVIGTAPAAGDNAGKLAALRLDQGMGGFGPLAARDSGVGGS